MKLYFSILISILLLFSCKEEKKFDYSLLEGHWLMDSVYSINQDTMLIENQIDGYTLSKRYFLFSEDMLFDRMIDSFVIEELQYLNKEKSSTYGNVYLYEVKNDSIQTYRLNYPKMYNERKFELNKHGLDFRVEYLDSNLLALEYFHSIMYYSKLNDTSYIKTKKDYIKMYEDFYSNDTLELK